MDPIIRRLHACILASVPCLLHGGPGTGKTARVEAYVAARQGHVERMLLSRCEPIDLKPRVYQDGKVVVCEPPEFERLATTAAAGKLAVFFADELNRASRETEGAALDRFDRSKGIAIVAACNPPTRGQAARTLESATANRFCHLDVPSDANAWAAAQLSGWDALESLQDLDAARYVQETSKARAIVAAYVRANGVDALDKCPQDPVNAGRAWPSPRTWEYATRVYAVTRTLGTFDAEDLLALVGGCIGTGLATEFLAYAADADAVDPEAVLDNPKAWTPPTRIDRTIGALAMVIAAVSRELTDARWRAAWNVLDVVANAGQPDAAMFAATSLLPLASKDAKGPKLTPATSLMPSRLAKLLAKSTGK